MVVGSSLLPSCSKTGGEIERLGAGAYRGSRCRLRHSISAVGPKIPYTKKRPLGPVLSPADKRHHIGLVDIQAIFCRRRHQPRRPPPAAIRPGRPAPTMGLLLARLLSENQALILELLDWKKFYVRQIVYFPNGHCRRRCGFRDGTFRHRLASTRVQPKTYRHRGEPGGNAYDRASHRSSPARAKLG